MSDAPTRPSSPGAGPEPGAEFWIEAVYAELRQLAALKMSHEPAGQTLQATALVHEVWLRLGGTAQPAWQNRAHFFAAAGEAMRRILVERARRHASLKRGAGAQQTQWDDAHLATPAPAEELLAVDEALERFASVDAEAAELVKLRYFVGLTMDETAEALGIPVRTAERTWAYARAWLKREIEGA